jgi:DNA-binding GntR family transcriptional regulator
MRLSRENLVETLPRRGTFVTEINITDLARVSEVRVQLEGCCSRLAAERATTEELAEAQQLDLEVVGTQPGLDMSSLFDLDGRVHHFCYRCAHNTFLEQTLDHYYYLALRMCLLVIDRVTWLADAVAEHHDLLRAIGERNAGWAEDVMRRHVTAFEAEIRKVI